MKRDYFCKSCPSYYNWKVEASISLISRDFVYYLVDFLGSARMRVEMVFWMVLCLRGGRIVLLNILSDDGFILIIKPEIYGKF